MRMAIKVTSIRLPDLGNLNVAGMPQNAERGQEPDDNADHDHDVEDLFDLPVHRNVVIDQPEEYSDDDESYDKGDHFESFVGLIRVVLMQENIDRHGQAPWGLCPIRVQPSRLWNPRWKSEPQGNDRRAIA
jgi:hypothetical protein